MELLSSIKIRPNKNLMGWVLLFLIVCLGYLIWWDWATEPYDTSGSSKRISIASGTTISQLAEELEEQHLIRSALAFKYLAHKRQSNFKIYVGDYILSPTMSPEDIINHLLKGSLSGSVKITIPEGYSTEQIVSLLVSKGLGTKEEFTKVIEQDSFSYSFLENVPQGAHRLEGYLFPNTYIIDRKTPPHDVINILLRQFSKAVTPDVQKQLAAKKLTVAQWVTIASLVEKEAAKESDRPLIASVIMNRLKMNMPLQIDATIQFLLGTPKAKLYNKDLQISSPYNTYLNKGLPPGPIANPGNASLQAALHPSQTDYLYYVAKKNGYHVFAKTYAEHLKNVKMYQGN